MEKQELRGYFFGNFYLSSIQQGIQAAHVIQEMYSKYLMDSSGASHMFSEWCFNEKTMILLNGGMHQDIYELYTKLNSLSKGVYPVAYFAEERRALNDAITCCGIVLPKRIYDLEIVTLGNETVSFDESLYQIDYNSTDVKIKELISQYKLAH